MLYFSRWKASAILLTTFVVCLFAVPNFFPETDGAVLAEMGAAPHRARPRPAGRLAHPARGRHQRGAQGKARDSCATTCAACCASRASATPAARRSAAARVEVRIREDGDLEHGADQAARTVAAARRPLERDRPAHARCRRCRQRLIRLTLTEPAIVERIRQAVDQSIQIIERRVNELGTVEPLDPAPGRRPHPGAGAGPAGPAAAEGAARQDREARLPHGRSATQRRSRRCRATCRRTTKCSTAPRRAEAALCDREARHGVGRRPHRRPARLRSAHQRADRQVPLQHRGARRFAQATQENVGRPFAIVLDNEVISAPVIREPILGGSGPDFRQLHGAERERPRHPAARRRAAGAADRSSRSAPSARASARTRSRRARCAYVGALWS